MNHASSSSSQRPDELPASIYHLALNQASVLGPSVIFYTDKLGDNTLADHHRHTAQDGRRRGWASGISAAPGMFGDVVLRFKDSAVDIYYHNLNSIKSVEYFLNCIGHILLDCLRDYLQKWRSLKFSLWLECIFQKQHNGQSEDVDTLLTNFKTKTVKLLLIDDNDIESVLIEQFHVLAEEIESLQKKGSGWSLTSVQGIFLRLTKCKPLKGEAKHISLPAQIIARKRVINVFNHNDDYCFKYAVLSSLTETGADNTNCPPFYRDMQHNFDFSPNQFLVNQPNFSDRFIFDDNLVGFYVDRKRVMFDMPIYVGFSILELSKSWMHHLFYDRLHPALGGRERVDLCYKDRRFILDVEVPKALSTHSSSNVTTYDKLNTIKELMNFSDYPSDHPCFSVENKKVVGKLKGEAQSKPIHRYIGLRSKLYGLQYGSRTIMKAKSVKKPAVKKNFCFDDFVKTLESQEEIYCNFSKISSQLHKVTISELRKVALSFFDDKCQIFEDRVLQYIQ